MISKVCSRKHVRNNRVYRLKADFQIDVATIVAKNGDVINFTRSSPPPPINLSDRDYYKAHAESNHVGDFTISQ